MQRQLRRWSHGFCQNLKLHWPGLLEQPHLRSFVIVSFVSRIADAALVFVATPLLTLLVHPLFLLLLAFDVPATWLPALVLAWRHGGLDRVLPSLPCTILQRLLSSAVFVGAVWSELVQGRSMRAFEKGH
jgi:biofilm PGA synthesis N-glycosyltransferase PgaC